MASIGSRNIQRSQSSCTASLDSQES